MTYNDLAGALRSALSSRSDYSSPEAPPSTCATPSCASPAHDSVFLGFPGQNDDELAYERYTIVDLEHVIRLEPLAA